MNPVRSLQPECDQLVDQFHDDFVILRHALVAAVQRVALMWDAAASELGGSVADLHGMIHCTDVRGTLLLHTVGFKNSEHPRMLKDLEIRYGAGMSAVLRDNHGMTIRVRKMPSSVFPEQGERLVVRHEPQPVTPDDLEAGEDGAADSPLVLPFVVPESEEIVPDGTPEWFVLYSFTESAVQVDEVFLAAVVGIDSPSTVAILASTPLPRQSSPRQVVGSDDDDFGGFFEGDARDGDDPSPA